MSAADSLSDALREIDAGRAAVARGDVGEALIYFAFANRHHALAMATHAIIAGAGAPPLANAAEIDAKLTALREEMTVAARRPAPAASADVLVAISHGLAPILRELATSGADPAAVVGARARNLAAILLGTFDIRTTTN